MEFGDLFSFIYSNKKNKNGTTKKFKKVKKYNLKFGDSSGKNDKATEIFNSNFIPYLQKCGIEKDKDFDIIFAIVHKMIKEAINNVSNDQSIESVWDVYKV